MPSTLVTYGTQTFRKSYDSGILLLWEIIFRSYGHILEQDCSTTTYLKTIFNSFLRNLRNSMSVKLLPYRYVILSIGIFLPKSWSSRKRSFEICLWNLCPFFCAQKRSCCKSQNSSLGLKIGLWFLLHADR